ncbi:hypothetical protein KP509_27G014800 [Ceratopteris richardii]|uniref:Reticulon-like protein n=1 Tax=Ceratopteris richardii TaxID=49495 RepID=A0A8T2RE22_CERRI|nr:hypothetical protein KP509_27G014800 [Ceratopteris richardii]
MTSSHTGTGPSSASDILDAFMDNFEQHIPSSGQRHNMQADSGFRALRRRHKDLHSMLGGGHSADVLLWRKKHLSAGFLAGATVLWLVFEWIGYHFISVVSFLLLGFAVIYFVLSNGAAFINRSFPPVPKLHLSENQVHYVAENFRVYANQMLDVFHEIVVGTDVTGFLKLVGALGFLVIFGSWLNLFTLVYLVVIAAHTFPVLYEKHGETIDELFGNLWTDLNAKYRELDASVLSKIPRKQFRSQRKAD